MNALSISLSPPSSSANDGSDMNALDPVGSPQDAQSSSASDSGGLGNDDKGNQSPTTSALPFPKPTPTSSTFSSSAAPTGTSSASSALNSSSSSTMPATSMPTSTSATTPIPTPTSFSSVPTPTSGGSTVWVTATNGPVSTQGAITGKTGESSNSSSPNLGAIIGGVAGGLVGIIVLCWLILIPVRKHAKRKGEVDWLSFKPDEHNHDEDGNTSIFRTPRAGVGEDEDYPTPAKEAQSGVGNATQLRSGEAYQMHEVHPGQGMQTLYGHLDESQWQTHGDAPPVEIHQDYHSQNAAMYDPNAYAAYYGHQQPAVGGYNQVSPQSSPEVGAYYVGVAAAPHAYAASTGQHGASSGYGYGYNPNGSPPGSNNDHQQMVRPHAAGQAGIQQTMQGDQSLQRGHAETYTAADVPSPLSRQTSDSATAFSHGAHYHGGEERTKRHVPQSSSGAFPHPTGAGLQRCNSNKELDKSDDFCLPYDREACVESPLAPSSNQHLHLANPDH